MKKGIERGVNIINDVSGLNFDKNLLMLSIQKIFLLFCIICKERQIQCKKIQSMMMLIGYL